MRFTKQMMSIVAATMVLSLYMPTSLTIELFSRTIVAATILIICLVNLIVPMNSDVMPESSLHTEPITELVLGAENKPNPTALHKLNLIKGSVFGSRLWPQSRHS